MKNYTRAAAFVLLLAAISFTGCRDQKTPAETESHVSQPATAEAGEKEPDKAQVRAGSKEPVTETSPVQGPAGEKKSLIDPEGTSLETRILVPEGYRRVPKEAGSFQGYMRMRAMKPDGSKVLLYDGTEKGNQRAQAAVFDFPVFESDLQQCADSVMRIYSEYFWTMGAYDKIAFHLTNGFLMDYPSWISGKRLAVDGNNVSWVKKEDYNDSYETFLLYLKYVMMYAGTLSLDEESVPVEIADLQAGDMFIKGGSPGHCVMVADVAEDEMGNLCFLLAQGYMPAQDFHILKNPLHEEDPWYYVSEITYPLQTPEYTFQEGSFKRWYGFLYKQE